MADLMHALKYESYPFHSFTATPYKYVFSGLKTIHTPVFIAVNDDQIGGGN